MRSWWCIGILTLAGLLSGCATPCGPGCTRTALATPANTGDEAVRLQDLSDAWWEHLMVTSPTWATYLGDRRFDDRLPDLSPEALDAHVETAQRLLDQLHKIDPATLPRARDGVTWAVLESILRRSIDGQICREETWSVDQLYGLQVWLPGLVNSHTVREMPDVETLAARYDATQRLVQQHIANLETGMAAGRTAFHIAVTRVIAQLDKLTSAPALSSPFVSGVTLPEAWTDETKDAARARLAQVVEASVYTALKRYRTFLSERYAAAARRTPGISTLADGRTCYAQRIRARTGSTLTPEAIHAIGMAELERLESAMRTIAQQVGQTDDLSAFAETLRGRADQVATSEEALLAVAEDAVARAKAAMPRVFGRLPKTEVVVKAIEPYRAASAPAAYYYSAPSDGSRPGVFYLNTHDLKERLLYNQEALAYHEAIPGHHLQLSLAAEVPDLPTFQRRQSQTAFVEGWGLYAELLADELGLYSSTLSRYGMLNYQAWRACRLVVDTGLHALGWSRQEAIDFMVAHTALTRQEVEVEIDRYIIWPGQALAYMLGRMDFQRLRKHAEEALGDRFDLRAFHDEVLAYGGIPMSVLQGVVDRWVASRTTD